MSRVDGHYRCGKRAARLTLATLSGLVAILLSAPVEAASNVLEELGCVDCHQLEPIPQSERTIERLVERKGPDLFYAGSKYRSEWLRGWLAEPKPIRPAGMQPAVLTERSAPGDVLSGAPPSHPAVPAARLEAVIEALETRDWGHDLLPNPSPVPAPVPRMLAELNFVKFKGCGSCHRTTANATPLSGPDLVDGWSRLQPAFLAAYLSNPQAWDPVAPMPGYSLAPAEVGKLMEYLRLLSEGSR